MSYIEPQQTKPQNRKVMVFHAPENLYEETNKIAEKEMVSLSAFCRMAVRNFVINYKQNEVAADKVSETSV